jgi:hydrogenase maturation protease
MKRILVACVGNPLRADDGFGFAVAECLQPLPDGVELVETGIGGVALLQELMSGFDGLIIVDAVDRGVEPGAVFAIEPEVAEPVHVPDVHLANPERVLSLAKGLGCLPQRILIVGCQPADVEALDQRLSPAVERAVPVAAERVRTAASEWLASS